MLTLASIALTTPAMLAGLTLLSLPVLAHLLNRRVRKRVIFPSLALLRESSASQSSLFRFRRWILLALRCLAAALIVYAFARPVWLSASAAPGPRTGAAAVVVVVDASASVGRQSGGVSLAASVQAAALRALEDLNQGTDLAAVVYAASTPRAAFPQLSHNLPVLRQDLRNFQPTFDRADLPAAIALAGDLLKQHDGPRRVVIVSDMQQTNWTELTQAGRLAELLPPGAQTTLLPVDDPGAANIALSRPRSAPAVPLLRQAAQLAVRVSNCGDRGQVARVDLSIDDQPAGTQSVTLAAGEDKDVAFEAIFAAAGHHRVMFQIGADALEADNRAFLAVRAVARPVVAVVADDDPHFPGSAGYFLLRALAPRGDAGDRFEVRHLTSADLTDAAVAEASVVVTGFLNLLTPGGAAALRRHVEQGGGLVFCCGEGPVPENLKALAAVDTRAPFAPLTVTAWRDLGATGDFAHITDGLWRSTLLADFNDRSRAALGQVRFTRVWSVPETAADAQALLRYADGTPALAGRSAGRGRVVLANFSPALTCSDLGKYGSFVALMQSLALDLQPSQALWGQATVGQSLAIPLPLEASVKEAVTALGPDAKPATAEVAAQAGGLLIHLPHPDRPGFYQIRQGNRTLSTVAVNLDPRESDLHRLDDAALQRLSTATDGRLVVRGAAAAESIIPGRGRPIWPWFVVAAMVALALEMSLVAWWKR